MASTISQPLRSGPLRVALRNVGERLGNVLLPFCYPTAWHATGQRNTGPLRNRHFACNYWTCWDGIICERMAGTEFQDWCLKPLGHLSRPALNGANATPFARFAPR